MRPAQTYEELRELIPVKKIRERVEKFEADHPGAQGLAPMTRAEAVELLEDLFDLATQRALTDAEAVKAGQLLAIFEMASRAEMLELKGRYFVISERQVLEQCQEE